MVIGQKVKFDIESDNFSLYYEKIISGITEEQKALLPKALGLFKVNGDVSMTRMRRLPFMAKMWILFRVFNKNVILTFADEPITEDEVAELKEAVKKSDTGTDKAQWLIAKGMFSIGPKELVDTYNYINRLSARPAYNYLAKGKNVRHTNTELNRRKMQYIVRFLRHYEANKKKWNIALSVTMAEYYVLLALYDKERLYGRDIYHKTFNKAYQSSIHHLKRGLKSLQSKGMIIKNRARTQDTTYSITPLGTEFINDVINKYAIDC